MIRLISKISPLFALVFVLIVSLFPISSLATLSILPSIINLSAQTSYQDFLIWNQDNKVAYLQITGARIEQPGTPQEKRVEVKNTADLGLLISPAKLAINPNQKRYVRIALTKPTTNQEQVYRLRVTPIISLEKTDVAPDMKMAGIKVVIAYGLLVIVDPNKVNPNLSIVRKGNQVTIINTGNTNIMLSHGQQCDAHNKCTAVGDNRLYPGNKWIFKVASSLPITFTKYYLDKVESLTIP